jgi:hypothetical protein
MISDTVILKKNCFPKDADDWLVVQLMISEPSDANPPIEDPLTFRTQREFTPILILLEDF